MALHQKPASVHTGGIHGNAQPESAASETEVQGTAFAVAKTAGKLVTHLIQSPVTFRIFQDLHVFAQQHFLLGISQCHRPALSGRRQAAPHKQKHQH